jgi:hypothetical protein
MKRAKPQPERFCRICQSWDISMGCTNPDILLNLNRDLDHLGLTITAVKPSQYQVYRHTRCCFWKHEKGG